MIFFTVLFSSVLSPTTPSLYLKKFDTSPFEKHQKVIRLVEGKKKPAVSFNLDDSNGHCEYKISLKKLFL
jgi:hypothetical protein